MNCKNCKARCYWAGQDVTEPDHGNCFVGYVPKTNADKIRAMSDEDLAYLLDDRAYPLKVWQGLNAGAFESTYDAWLWWLRQEEE